MSWEIVSTENHPCECRAGTFTYTFEMDDWNRTRSSTEIHCPQCREKRRLEQETERARECRRERLLARAQHLMKERYLVRWLTLFEGVTKKAAWERYTGASGYPALGTFYQHVKHSGSLSKYMEWCLTSDLERSLRVLGVKDKEIDGLLQERKQLWKPTSGPL